MKKKQAIKINKISKKLNSLKLNKNIEEDDLLLLLNEADKITLDELEFDNILKEQSKMLCNINDIVSKEGNIKGQIKSPNNEKQNPLCNIIKLNNDSKFKKILSKYKKSKEISLKPIKNINSNSKKITIMKYASKKPTVIKYNSKNKTIIKKYRRKTNKNNIKKSKKSSTKKSSSKKSSSKKSSSKLNKKKMQK